MALVENLQRRDLSFMEEAQAIARLIQMYGLSQEQAAQKIGKSQSAVANKLRLLRLCPKVLQRLQENQLTERHARALLRIEDENEQLRVLEHIIRNVLNVAQTEAYIDSILTPSSPAPKRRRNTYVIKDVRIFLNSVSRGLRMMKNAGVNAEYGQTETDQDILLTIRIPKRGANK